MTDPGIIFQRTHAGRDEIHQKSHGLTQSERLVLIMVDGVSTYGQLRAKLPVLTDERFDRALQKLQLKELVLEVFMPLEGQAPEELERTVIDRFLQQDPMDPVTVMMLDPEEEFGLMAPAVSVSQPVAQSATASVRDVEPQPVLDVERTAPSAAPAVVDPGTPPAMPGQAATFASTHPVPAEPAMDAAHAEMADLLAAELRAKRALKPTPAPQRTEAMQPAPAVMLEARPEPSPFTAVHWGYWLIVSGLSFILGFVLARVTA